MFRSISVVIPPADKLRVFYGQELRGHPTQLFSAPVILAYGVPWNQRYGNFVREQGNSALRRGEGCDTITYVCTTPYLRQPADRSRRCTAMRRNIISMIILGIDPGFAITGFGVVEADRGCQRLVQCGAITTPAGAPLPRRLLQISGDMGRLLELFHPDAMAVEELFFSNNVTTGIGVAQARGVLLTEAERFGVPIFEYSPSQVKLAVVGYGKAEKRQVMDMTRRLLGLKTVPKPDDAADAVAIALCHARSYTSRLQRPDDARPGSGRYAVRPK